MTQLCSAKLAPAVFGNSLDLDHDLVAAYLKKRSDPEFLKRKKTGPKTEKENRVQKAVSVVSIPSELADYAEWTIREVLSKFGTEYQFKEFLAASKIISAIQLQELEMSRRRNELVEREMVDDIVFKGFETLFLRILGASKKISLKVHTMAKSGLEPEKCEAATTQILSQLLKTAKAEIVNGMKKI